MKPLALAVYLPVLLALLLVALLARVFARFVIPPEWGKYWHYGKANPGRIPR